MQYRIYCEHFVRLLRMFGSLQNSKVYIQIFSNKYILRVYYTDDEYIQFVVEEQQFTDVVIEASNDINPIVLLDTTTVELLSKLALKDTKSDLVLDISSAYYQERVISYKDISYKVFPSYLYSTFEYLDTNTTLTTKLDTKLVDDIVNINTKCALNQNHQLYLNFKQGLIILNKDASIASYIDNQYILPDCEQTTEDLEFIIIKPKFISNFIGEVKIDSSTDIYLYSNILHLNSYVSVGKKELFKYQLYIKFSSVTNRQKWLSLLELKNEIQRKGKTKVLSLDKIQQLILQANENKDDIESMLYITKNKQLSGDIILRIFRPLISKEIDNLIDGIKIVLYRDKMLVFNDNDTINLVTTVTTLNIKLSDAQD